MRTKALLCAAALAAGALTSMAQVYSANVVGYVNVTVTGGGNYTLLANPLDATMGGTVANGNNLTNVFGARGDADRILRWDVGLSRFVSGSDVAAFSAFTGKWTTGFDLKVGSGFFYDNENDDFVVTFVGQVLQGSPAFTYGGGFDGTAGKVAGSGAFEALGAPVPIGGSFTNAIVGITPGDSDAIYVWDPANAKFKAPAPAYSAFTGKWTLTADSNYFLAPGVGFFYNNNNDDITWTRTFTVQ